MGSDALKAWQAAVERVRRSGADLDAFGRNLVGLLDNVRISIIRSIEVPGMSGSLEGHRVSVAPDPASRDAIIPNTDLRLDENGRVPLVVSITFGHQQFPVIAAVPCKLRIEASGKHKVVVGGEEFDYPDGAQGYASKLFDLAAAEVERSNLNHLI